MRTIHKFTVQINGKSCLPIPDSAKAVSVAEQDGFLRVWIELDTTHAITNGRWFAGVSTGWELDNFQCKAHVGTVHVHGYVWHVYECEP